MALSAELPTARRRRPVTAERVLAPDRGLPLLPNAAPGPDSGEDKSAIELRFLFLDRNGRSFSGPSSPTLCWFGDLLAPVRMPAIHRYLPAEKLIGAGEVDLFQCVPDELHTSLVAGMDDRWPPRGERSACCGFVWSRTEVASARFAPWPGDRVRSHLGWVPGRWVAAPAGAKRCGGGCDD